MHLEINIFNLSFNVQESEAQRDSASRGTKKTVFKRNRVRYDYEFKFSNESSSNQLVNNIDFLKTSYFLFSSNLF